MDLAKGLPKEVELALFIIAFIIVAARVRYGFKVLEARRNIFSAERRFFGISIIANIGYAAVALLLGIYFLLLYLGKKVTAPFFEAGLLFLLIVLIVEATFKRKA